MAAAPIPATAFKWFAAPVNCAGPDCVIDAIDAEPLIAVATDAPVALVIEAVDGEEEDEAVREEEEEEEVESGEMTPPATAAGVILLEVLAAAET